MFNIQLEVHMPQISVVMPAYNTKEEYLREAIESILKQTFGDFEFIIINDCSTTNVEEIILSYKDERIKYLKNEQNLGIAKTLNRGIKEATGKYIARMDSDDISFENRFEIQHKFLEQNPQFQLCSTRLSKSKGDSYSRGVNFEYLKAKIFFRGNPIIHPTVMFNREFFADNGLLYNEMPYGEDWDLWFRLTQVGQFAVLPDKLLYYRQHPGQANKTHEDRHYDFCKKQFRENLRTLGFEINAEKENLLINFFIGQEPENLSFKKWKILTSEVFRLLAFIKKSKKVSYKYSFVILMKQLVSYTKYALFS